MSQAVQAAWSRRSKWLTDEIVRRNNLLPPAQTALIEHAGQISSNSRALFTTVLRDELDACFCKGVANIRKRPLVGRSFFG